jgi:hypothetical protein
MSGYVAGAAKEICEIHDSSMHTSSYAVRAQPIEARPEPPPEIAS